MTYPVTPTPGWYPDPWTDDHYRYWNGDAWTGHTFPAAAGVAAGDRGPGAPRGVATAAPSVAPSDPAPPPPGWSPPPNGASWEPAWARPEAVGTPPAPAASRFSLPARFVALFVSIGVIAGFAAVVGTRLAARHRSPATTAPLAASPFTPRGSSPSTTPNGTPSAPADPSASILSGLVVSQRDVASTIGVVLLPEGNQVSQPTLDLCNGTFPSEASRRARLQVVAVDEQGAAAISTEAVLYPNPAATAQAFSELKSTAAACPSTPVVSPVGEPTVTTRFAPAPDGGWPRVANVERLAYDFVATDASGQTQHSVAVYLRRGRALLGVYFSQPDGPQISVAGQTTIAGIVGVFENRMAGLPAAVDSGG